MKRIWICSLLLLYLLAGCVATPQPTDSTIPTETTATEEPPSESTTEEPVEIDAHYIYRSYQMVLEAKELAVTEDESCEGFLFDIDGDGILELAFLYTETENGSTVMRCDLYTLQDGVLIPLLERHLVYYLVGGATGLIGVAENDGNRYFAIKAAAADWRNGYQERLGRWELYALNDGALTLQTEISFDYLHAGEEGGGFRFTDKPDSIDTEIQLAESTFTMNSEAITAEQYALWLDSTTFWENIDGFAFGGEENSLEALQFYCSWELLMEECDGELRQELWERWYDGMGLSDSAAWTEQEWVEDDTHVYIALGILHENPMNRYGTWEMTLEEKIAVQYHHWEETGELDYVHVSSTPPYYQVTAIAVNATNICAEVQIRINGTDFGTYTLNHNTLILPVDSDPIPANTPATVEFTLLSGTLPKESQVIVCLNSNITGAR